MGKLVDEGGGVSGILGVPGVERDKSGEDEEGQGTAGQNGLWRAEEVICESWV